MPVVLGIGAEAFGWLLLLYLGLKFAQAVTTAFDIHVPVLGRPFHGLLRTIENAMLSAWNDFLRPHIRKLVSWFKAVADIVLDFPAAILLFAGAVVEAFDYLRHTALPAVIHAALVPYAKAINALHAADIAIGHRIGEVDNRLTHGIDRLRDYVQTEVFARLARGIDRLRHDVFEVTLPALIGEINRADVALEHGIQSLYDDATAIEKQILDLAKRLEIPLSLVETLIASVGLVAALEALQTLTTCRGKLRSLCQYDPGLWDEFLLGVLALIAFPGLREMAHMGASLMEDISGAVQELAES